MLRKIKDVLGIGGLAAIIFAPFVAAMLMALALPSLTRTDVRAHAVVPLVPVTGTHAAYEAATYVADFNAAMTGVAAAEAAARAAGTDPGTAAGLLEAVRMGDNTTAEVAFVSSTPEKAEAGLRAAVAEGLNEIVRSNLKRAQIEYDAATQGLPELLKGVDDDRAFAGTLQAKDKQAVRDGLLVQATQRVESTYAALQSARRSEAAVRSLTEGIQVETAPLTSAATDLRLILGAAVSALVVASAIVLVLRRDRLPREFRLTR